MNILPPAGGCGVTVLKGDNSVEMAYMAVKLQVYSVKVSGLNEPDYLCSCIPINQMRNEVFSVLHLLQACLSSSPQHHFQARLSSYP